MRRINMRKGFNPQLIGKGPTTAQKIANTSNKLGIPGIKNQQGSSLNIFDTVTLTTGANRQNLVFFKNASTKSRNFSNWQALEFKAGETLGVEYLTIELLQLSAASLADDATAISGVFPVGRTLASTILAYGMMSLKIANSTVIKDFLLKSALPEFNRGTSGITTVDSATVTEGVIGRSIIQLPATPVIPPNQGIELIIEIPPITTGAGNWAVQVSMGEQGSIFSANTTL